MVRQVTGGGQEHPDGPPAPPGSPAVRGITAILAAGIPILAIIWASELPVRAGIIFFREQALAAFLGLSLPIVFLRFPSGKRAQNGPPWYDLLAALLGFVAAFYISARYPVLSQEFFYRPVETFIPSVIVIILVVEALRRTAGWFLVGVVLFFITYGLLGHWVPGQLAGRSLEVANLVSFLGIDNVAMLGLPLYVISTIVIVFVFMGQLLLKSGGSAFFTDLSAGLMGRTRGGPAKIAVVASGLFGSISGSAVSNVAATGVITIPLMMQAGYLPRVAAAIEAVASTGGQIMPPIMGAAAFLIAEFLEVPYMEVMLAALVPAILYYFALLVQVDLEAGRIGIAPMSAEDVPSLRRVMKEGWFFLMPFVVLILGLFTFNLAPDTSALYAAVSIVVLTRLFSYRGHGLSLRNFIEAFKTTGIVSTEIIVIGAAAGMIIGILDVTGLGFGLTFVLVKFGEGNLLLLLVTTAFICIILGMGMPTTAIYFLLATMVAPALVKVGVVPMAAHLFVMYFGLMSMISPPVAIAAFAAANIARADVMATGFTAVRFGWLAYLVPFLFVYSPTLLLEGEALQVTRDVLSALAGVWLTSIGLTGFFLQHLSFPWRAGFVIAGVATLFPGSVLGNWAFLEMGGVGLGVALVAHEVLTVRRLKRSSPRS